MAEKQANQIRGALEDAKERYDRVEKTLEEERIELNQQLKNDNKEIDSVQRALDKYTDIGVKLVDSEFGKTVDGHTYGVLCEVVCHNQKALKHSKEKRAETMDNLAHLTDKVAAFIDDRNALNRDLAKLEGASK